MKYAKVEGHVNLVRDQSTKAILNTNMSEYNEYISLRNFKKSEDEKIDNLKNEVSNLKNDLEEIKNLLRNLTNGFN